MISATLETAAGEETHTPQEEHWQLEPQLQEEGPEHWQGPIVIDGELGLVLVLKKDGIGCFDLFAVVEIQKAHEMEVQVEIYTLRRPLESNRTEPTPLRALCVVAGSDGPHSGTQPIEKRHAKPDPSKHNSLNHLIQSTCRQAAKPGQTDFSNM